MKKFAGIVVAVMVAFALGSVVDKGLAQSPAQDPLLGCKSGRVLTSIPPQYICDDAVQATTEKPKADQAKPEQPPVVSTETKLTIQNLSLQYESATKTHQLVQLQMAQIYQSLQREGWDFNPATLEYTKKK